MIYKKVYTCFASINISNGDLKILVKARCFPEPQDLFLSGYSHVI